MITAFPQIGSLFHIQDKPSHLFCGSVTWKALWFPLEKGLTAHK